MRFLFIICFLLSFNVNTAQTLQLQEQKTSQELYDFHIQKMKTNKLLAWVCLGAGATSILLNTASNSVDVAGNNNSEWVYYAGGALTLVSVPFFLSASHHKKKAQLYVSQGAVGFNNEYKFSGLGIAIRF